MVVYRERNQIMNPCVVQYNENKKNLKQKKKRAFDIYFTLSCIFWIFFALGVYVQ